MTRRQRGATAAEVMAEKQRRLREDPQYRAQFEQVEAEQAERADRLRQAERPLVEELRSVGCELETVWDLHKLPDEARARAVPVLLKHLRHDYPDNVLMGIGVGLNFPGIRRWWSDLATLYRATDTEVVRDRLAAVLSTQAVRKHYDDLLAFVADEHLGTSRVYFLRPINRIGNRMNAGQGRAVIEALANDPTFVKEATAILKGCSSNE